MNLVLVSRDLMLQTRVEGAAQKLGVNVIVASDDESALSAVADETCRSLLIDLRLPGLQLDSLVAAIRQGSALPVTILACGPHVHQARLEEASAAGCDRVLTRGQFDRDAESVLRETL